MIEFKRIGASHAPAVSAAIRKGGFSSRVTQHPEGVAVHVDDRIPKSLRDFLASKGYVSIPESPNSSVLVVTHKRGREWKA